MSKKDQNYEATRLHFENLVKRYGNPIIILNLIKVNVFSDKFAQVMIITFMVFLLVITPDNLFMKKLFLEAIVIIILFILFLYLSGNRQTREKKPRESILRTEFANAIEFINKDLSEDKHLRFLHWDLHKHSRRYIF